MRGGPLEQGSGQALVGASLPTVSKWRGLFLELRHDSLSDQPRSGRLSTTTGTYKHSNGQNVPSVIRLMERFGFEAYGGALFLKPVGPLV